MTAPINHRSTDTYPVSNNTRWTGARAAGEAGVEVPADRVHVVDMDYRADWAETAADSPSFIRNKPTIVNVPALPTTAGDYKLNISSGGVASWVAITG